jgi:hypothetical protein
MIRMMRYNQSRIRKGHMPPAKHKTPSRLGLDGEWSHLFTFYGDLIVRMRVNRFTVGLRSIAEGSATTLRSRALKVSLTDLYRNSANDDPR